MQPNLRLKLCQLLENQKHPCKWERKRALIIKVVDQHYLEIKRNQISYQLKEAIFLLEEQMI